jgi:transcription termination factor Rho
MTTTEDVLVPVTGIVDVTDRHGFIRTLGYLPGPDDVYVSVAQLKQYGLRRGDLVTGTAQQTEARQGSARRDRHNPLVRVDTVNGADPHQARRRPEFATLTPLYPQERLRLETEPHLLTTRVIDLVMPIGKGQRALIVSPPKAGKTMVLQAIANAITHNNPECHLMVVLVDERPEEVTDMQRSVKGEVIASTFDRPPSDHTALAELSIERAKRLVEAGQDVVVLLDSITRLGRAYNNASPVSGRILAGGIDAAALYPPKRILGYRTQHRERRLADHHRDRHGRDRLHRRHGAVRGVQVDRQRGVEAGPQDCREAGLPRHRYRPVWHPQGGTSARPGRTGRHPATTQGATDLR